MTNKLNILILVFLSILFSSASNAQLKYSDEENFNFTNDYIKANKTKFIVEVPEVHELANIMVALTKVGQLDSNMVDMKSKYYQEVMAHFSTYKNHPAIDTLNHYIVKPRDNQSYYYYFTLKMDACAYEFKGDEIVNQGYIKKLSWPFYKNPYDQFNSLFEDFAKKSGFRKFYNKNKSYYAQLITTYEEINQLAQMRTWLQSKFKMEFGSYKAVFSPLVGGAHAAKNYLDNGFDHRYMFIAKVEYSGKNSKEYDQINQTRILFTEIDHHFVNALTEKRRLLLNEVLKNRSKWTDDTKPGATAYPDGFSIFNEYMTWGLYSLYCYDRYQKVDVDLFMKSMTDKMNQKGYPLFEKFNSELIRTYNLNKNIDMVWLTDHMIEWCKTENTKNLK